VDGPIREHYLVTEFDTDDESPSRDRSLLTGVPDHARPLTAQVGLLGPAASEPRDRHQPFELV
jgi:hypothetical protein